MATRERAKYFTYLGFRALVSLLDVIGVLAIGFLATSIALFVTLGSDPSRVIEFGGLTLPAVTANSLPIFAGLALALFIIKAVISIALTRQLAFFLAKIEARASRIVAEKAFGEDQVEARRFSRDEIYIAVQHGSPAAFNTVLNALGTVVAEGFLFLLVLASFMVVDPPSALGALIYFGCITAVTHFFIGSKLQTSSGRVAEGLVSANQAIGDLSEVLREATIFGKKEIFLNKIFEARLKTASSMASQQTLNGLPRYIVETSLLVAIALFILVQSAKGDIVSAAATIGIFLSGGLRLTASLLPLQNAVLNIRESIPIAQKALNFLESGQKIALPKVQVQREQIEARDPVEVVLEAVSFRYPGADYDALKQISLDIKPGQQVALIGPSGAGKSTLADLILGLLIPTEGRVRLSGEEPRHVISETPGRLSYVPQRPGMVSGTIAENIAFSARLDESDLPAIEAAIKAAHLSQIMENLPKGSLTDVGKRKDELSGGQLQRIGLARAFFSSPGLLIMDEATSALDAESENEINKSLDDMRGKITVILIAHRLNTVQRSDVVFLVEDGRITASGTFPQLLKSNKTVQNLAKLMSIQSAD
jgi:ATP-binding cassette, subfamily B, bacterial PglK